MVTDPGAGGTDDPRAAPSLEHAREVLGDARRITVMTGAGISVDSGIPDFRGPAGLFTSQPDAISWFTRSVYERSVAARRHFWALRHALLEALPNAGHLAVTALERSGRLHGVITQNIDGLHQKAGTSDALVHEVHGSVLHTTCLGCGERRTVDHLLRRLDSGEADPRCERCGGVLKPDVVMYEELLDEAVFDAATRAAESCDAFVAVGSTLDVFPAAMLPAVAVERGVPLVVVNLGPTRYDDVATARVQHSATTVLPLLFGEEHPEARDA